LVKATELARRLSSSASILCGSSHHAETKAA
jgi:hypothetical protein